MLAAVLSRRPTALYSITIIVVLVYAYHYRLASEMDSAGRHILCITINTINTTVVVVFQHLVLVLSTLIVCMFVLVE